MKQEPKLLLDENIGLKVYYELKKKGYHVQSVILKHRGIPDEEVIKLASEEHKIIVTMDKDFGYLAQSYKPPGVIILRLKNPNIYNRIKLILKILNLKEKLYGYIIIASETRMRKRPLFFEK